MSEKYFYPLDIDFEQLRYQKTLLVEISISTHTTEISKNKAEGLLSIIDAIQDYAVESQFLNEEEIFGDLDVVN